MGQAECKSLISYHFLMNKRKYKPLNIQSIYKNERCISIICFGTYKNRLWCIYSVTLHYNGFQIQVKAINNKSLSKSVRLCSIFSSALNKSRNKLFSVAEFYPRRLKTRAILSLLMFFSHRRKWEPSGYNGVHHGLVLIHTPALHTGPQVLVLQSAYVTESLFPSQLPES